MASCSTTLLRRGMPRNGSGMDKWTRSNLAFFCRTLSELEASAIVRKITSAVAYMHACGVVHRDLKPGMSGVICAAIFLQCSCVA